MNELKAIELQDTAEMMTSPDYKERFKAEYYQLEIRIGKLGNTLDLLAKGAADFKPICPGDLLEAQLNSMKAYHYILRERARREGIEL